MIQQRGTADPCVGCDVFEPRVREASFAKGFLGGTEHTEDGCLVEGILAWAPHRSATSTSAHAPVKDLQHHTIA
jgi:hypothetical protein